MLVRSVERLIMLTPSEFLNPEGLSLVSSKLLLLFDLLSLFHEDDKIGIVVLDF